LRPTIVLVHGAFAESASWNHAIDPLVTAGHPVIAAANPLRGLAADAAAVGDLLRTDVPARSSSASWPSAPARAARSRSQAPRMRSPSRSLRRRPS
jgi:hypothetical protein